MDKQFNPFSLEGRNIIVTGASSGIGQQVAISCSKMGARVILIGRNEVRLEETIAQMEGRIHIVYSFDLTHIEEMKGLVSDIVSKTGPLNGVVNCAGISTTNLFKLTKLEELDRFFRANVYSGYFLTQECTKMGNFSKEGGSVIFFSSIAGCFGEVGKSTYGMTKAALLNLSKHLACELARKNIRVNTISPGAICTPINMNLPHMKDPEKRAALETQHLLGLGKTTDVANACIYLLSDASRWVTGTNLFVDGGFSAR